MTSSSTPRPRPTRHGLLDFALAIVLVYAVYAKTPLGAIAETGINVARGQKEHPSWLATFKGHEIQGVVVEDAKKASDAAEGALPAPIVAAAAKYKVDPEAVAAIVTTHGTCAPTTCEVEAPPRVGAVHAPIAGKTKLDADDIAAALASGQRQLDNDAQLAIEAMWLGPIAVRLAVEQAKRSNAVDAGDIETHAEFFTPSDRRGPLQGALAVLAVYRLRTLAWPQDPTKYRITSPFGERTDPISGAKDFHNGTDLGVPAGTPLWAAHNGRVKRQSRDSMSGNYVVLDHGLGITTVYCHMTEADVVEGAHVKRKDVIGLSGATGRVTGPHLHYILRIRDKSVDAAKYGESPVRNRSESVEVPVTPPPAAPAKPAKPAPKEGPKPKPAKPDTPAKTAPVEAGPAAPAPTPAPADAGPAAPTAATPVDAGSPAHD